MPSSLLESRVRIASVVKTDIRFLKRTGYGQLFRLRPRLFLQLFPVLLPVSSFLLLESLSSVLFIKPLAVIIIDAFVPVSKPSVIFEVRYWGYCFVLLQRHSHKAQHAVPTIFIAIIYATTGIGT